MILQILAAALAVEAVPKDRKAPAPAVVAGVGVALDRLLPALAVENRQAVKGVEVTEAAAVAVATVATVAAAVIAAALMAVVVAVRMAAVRRAASHPRAAALRTEVAPTVVMDHHHRLIRTENLESLAVTIRLLLRK